MKKFIAGYAVGMIPVAIVLADDIRDPEVQWPREDLKFLPLSLVAWPWVMYKSLQEVQ